MPMAGSISTWCAISRGHQGQVRAAVEVRKEESGGPGGAREGWHGAAEALSRRVARYRR